MNYTIIKEGRSYDLPKKTLTVTEKMDEVLRVDANPNMSVRQKFEKLHNFVKETLGEEEANEILGSSNLNEIDLSELTLTVRMIVDEYDRPVSEYETNKRKSQIEALPLDKIVAMTKAAQTVSAQQMVRK